jgi:hypothetical protein
MAHLLALLQELDPTISPTMAAELRAALVAISLELQCEGSSRQFSFNDWWQWLDQEGYDPVSVLSVLRQLCRARLGADADALLAGVCQSHANAPAGLALLLARLDQLDPDVTDEWHHLERLAISEEHELNQTSGGSARKKLNSVIALGIVATGIFYYVDGKKQKKFEADMNALDRKMRQNLLDKTEAIHRSTREAMTTGREDVRMARNDTRMAEAKLEEAFSKRPRDTLQRLYNVNKDVYNNVKDIRSYSRRDVDDRVAKLVAEHILNYTGHAALEMADSTIKTSPEFRARLGKAVLEGQKTVRPGVTVNGKEASQRAEEGLMRGDFVHQQRVRILSSPEFTALREQEVQRLGDVYRQMLDFEIQTAKQEAENPASAFLEKRIKFEGDKIICESKVVIHKDILSKFDAAARDARDAERAAERESTVIIEELP